MTAAYSPEHGVDTGAAVERLLDFLDGRRRPFVLTGAGCSTGSGIPDYRDRDGGWKRSPPIQWQAFRQGEQTRQRYWARSFVGWPRVAAASPNAAHHALVELERVFPGLPLVTQNVDGLHQRAGSDDVVDLHGRLDRVICLDCGGAEHRERFQRRLSRLNPAWGTDDGPIAPDGDVDLGEADYGRFQIPGCTACGGLVKPDVVFFGENVPKPRLHQAFGRMEQADAVVVVGSSLMVWSGYRFVRRARELGLPVAVLNEGRTRADDEIDLKIHACCTQVLPGLARALDAAAPPHPR